VPDAPPGVSSMSAPGAQMWADTNPAAYLELAQRYLRGLEEL
jgi:hypothetical protein